MCKKYSFFCSFKSVSGTLKKENIPPSILKHELFTLWILESLCLAGRNVSTEILADAARSQTS